MKYIYAFTSIVLIAISSALVAMSPEVLAFGPVLLDFAGQLFAFDAFVLLNVALLIAATIWIAVSWRSRDRRSDFDWTIGNPATAPPA